MIIKIDLTQSELVNLTQMHGEGLSDDELIDQAVEDMSTNYGSLGITVSLVDINIVPG